MKTPNDGQKFTLLITGASGLSGSIVVNEFLSQQIPVRILVRNADKVKHLQNNPNVEIFVGDLLKPETYASALQGIDKALDMEEACAIISEAINRKVTFNDISLEDYKSMVSGIGAAGKTLEILMQVSKERRKCTNAGVKLETHQLFNIRPTNFAEFIYRHKSAFEKLN